MTRGSGLVGAPSADPLGDEAAHHLNVLLALFRGVLEDLMAVALEWEAHLLVQNI